VTANLWPEKPGPDRPPFKADPGTAERQWARLYLTRSNRDAGRVQAALSRIEAACHTNSDMVEPVLEAVRAYATLGEICDVWRKHFGVFEANTAF
jgi:methylmalonyl-CoA mutase N-terminal domain/subunit